jgi:hypothetical protein
VPGSTDGLGGCRIVLFAVPAVVLLLAPTVVPVLVQYFREYSSVHSRGALPGCKRRAGQASSSEP